LIDLIDHFFVARRLAGWEADSRGELMARVLLISMPFAGHVGPLAAAAAELVRRGHRVVGYCGAKYRDRFAGAGADWLPWTRAQDFDDTRLTETFPRVGNGKGLRGALANSRYVLLGTATGQAQDIIAAAQQEPFDLIVGDQLAYGGLLAGEVLGTPWASVAVTPLALMSRDLPPPGSGLDPGAGRAGRLRDAALRRVAMVGFRWLIDPRTNRLRATVGLGPASIGGLDSLYSPHLVLAQGVPGLEYPRTDLPSHVHYVGRLATPVAQPTGSAVPLPPWWPEVVAARAAGRPVVHVTQGTLDLDFDDLIRPTIAGLLDGPADQRPLLVCATGGQPTSILESRLGPLPDNVRAAPHLPYDRFLPLVDVMVTNGGWGGVLAAVEAGVPLVVAGASLDKPEVARRVAWSGAGLNLRTGMPSPRKVRDAVLHLLGDARTRDRVRELGAALTAAGGTTTAGDLLEQLITRFASKAPG
jgi:UDP:flavonoid glycosyltransferase YjiC (YdhE family)